MLKKIIVVSLLATLCACSEKQHSAEVEIATSDTATLADPAAAKQANEQAEALFEEAFEQAIMRSPEFQTFLGRETNMDKWDNLSAEFAAESLQINKQVLTKLTAIDATQLTESTALSYKLMKQNLENDIEDYQWRLYNYPVNQMFGTHTRVPSTLINQHRISKIKHAEDYITRLRNVGPYFDQLIDGLKARAEAGIIPPKFVFPHVIRDSQNIIKGAPFDDGEDNALLADLRGKLDKLTENKKVALTEEKKTELLASAEKALTESFKPAYQKLIAYLTALETKATTDDGVWKWKNGATFYDVALARTTTTELTSNEIHQIGLAEVARIHDEMRKIKDAVKFDGDLRAFMGFMRDDEQFYYANNPEGKARYLKEATELIATMKGNLDEMFITKPKADLTVKAVEAFREQSAGKAFYQRPSEDGTRPGLYYANLFDMKAMPTYQMEALAYHEGVPGHHMQIAISQELKGVPKFRKFGNYTAYIEGWGLYSEMLPKEFGFYSNPYSDFGRLAMELWRACRLVVDTGIHSKKWTREEGVSYYVDNTPNAESDAVKMVERHIVMPSQATAYKIGMLKIIDLRQNAQQKLNDKFDIREYHDEVLRFGPVPLNVLDDNIQNWVAKKLAK